MSDMFGNHIVGFPTRRLNCYLVQYTRVSIHVRGQCSNEYRYILRFIVTKPEEFGPACTINSTATWKGKPHLISCPDVVPALKLPWEMYNNLLTMVEEFVVNDLTMFEVQGRFS